MLILLWIIILLSGNCFAANAPLNVKTQDGTVSVYPYSIKVTNGSLTNNGDGTASLTTGGGSGGSPGGSNTQVQYNSSGSFAGNSGFVYTGTNVGIGTVNPVSEVDVEGSVTPVASTVNQGSYYNFSIPLSGDTATSVTVGLQGNVTTTGTGNLTTGGHTIGFYGKNTHNGSGALPLQIGAQGDLFNTGGGSVSLGAMVAGNMNSLNNGSTYNVLVGFVPEIGNIASANSITTYVDHYCDDFSGVANVPANRYCVENIDAGKAIYTAGNIGMGTYPSNDKLEIYSAGPGVRLESSSSSGYLLNDFATDTKLWRMGSANSGEAIFGIPNKFVLYDSNAGAMRWVVDTAGNVGIGSVNPGQKLDIVGSARATSFIKTSGTSSQFLKADGSSDSSTYLTGNQTITLSSDVTGSGTTAITATLKNTGTAGTYRSTTFDAQGRETSGTNPTTFSGYAISDTSANLATALTDETGTGANVFATNATMNNVGIGTTLTTTSGLTVMAGNVGIGTWVPQDKLIIQGGNLGIGTNLPGALMEIKKDSLGTTQAAGLILRNTTTGSIQLGPGVFIYGNAFTASTNFPIDWDIVPSNVDTIGSGLDIKANIPSLGSSVAVIHLTYNGQVQIREHLQAAGTAPTIANNDCGSTTQGTVSAGSTDLKGHVTPGTLTVTSCAMTFHLAYNTAPECICQDDSTALLLRCTESTTKLTIASATSMSGDNITYHCIE